MIEHERAGREPGRCRLEHAVDRGVIGEHEVNAVDTTHRLGGIGNHRRAIGSEGLCTRDRAIPDADGLALLEERTREAGTEQPRTEDRDCHARSLAPGMPRATLRVRYPDER